MSVTDTTSSMTKPTDLVQGTLDILILKMLAFEPMNGWGINHRLRQLSSDALQVSHGSLYPALHKLESDGLITSEWRTTESNRRAKFYTLTKVGRKFLRIETDNWERLSQVISTVLRLHEV
jgi:transcriptional regulator